MCVPAIGNSYKCIYLGIGRDADGESENFIRLSSHFINDVVSRILSFSTSQLFVYMLRDMVGI